jgi:mRNA interferase RelE/StbE
MFEGNISDRRRVAGRIQDLANEPRPTGCEKLSGKDRHRLRQGDYRIVYAIDDKKRAITVVRIGHRKEVHR